jgi:hypothetical protein
MTPMGFPSYDGAAWGRPDGVSHESEPDPASGPDLRQSVDREEIPMDAATSRLEGSRPGDRLTERDRGILEFERQWWKYAGAKEQAIRDLFDMSATRYYQILNGLIDTQEALAFDPMLVKRLRRMRAARQRARSARRLGIELESR